MANNGWTLKRRQRQAELIHYWKPWKLSTGAKTLEGKEISKMNSVKHGGYSSTALAKLNLIKEFLNLRINKPRSHS